MSVLLSTYISAVTGIIARDFLNTLFNQYQCTIQTQSSFFLLFCFCFSLGLCFHLVVFVFCIVLLLFFFFFFFFTAVLLLSVDEQCCIQGVAWFCCWISDT